MFKIIDLIDFSPADNRVALERLGRDPGACADDYRQIMREIPNLHHFLSRVRNLYPTSYGAVIWFRLWSAMKAEEEIGLNTTISLLRKMPNIDDRNVNLSPRNISKPLTHCFVVLHELIESA